MLFQPTNFLELFMANSMMWRTSEQNLRGIDPCPTKAGEPCTISEKIPTSLRNLRSTIMTFLKVLPPFSNIQLSVHGPGIKFPNNTRPDATIHLTKSSFKWTRVQIDHGDVCLYVQFKKKNTRINFEDDTSALLWNVHHRFRSDPCCRFVCGLTIENTTARFWHFSRPSVMVSKPFDIILNPDKLIHIFVGSARAKSPAKLGFDPTITCIIEDSEAAERQYKIQVSDNKDRSQESISKENPPRVRTFITRRTIANSYRAVGTRSRGTWVCEGIEEDPQDTPVVIKD
ncbi:hypothetical protein M408DRAFT_28666, partial [Serendipita vermifera MAFF 305830]